MLRCRENVCPTRLEHAHDLTCRAIGIEDVLEDILGHEEVEGLVVKSELLKVFRTNTITLGSKFHVAEKLGGRVGITISADEIIGRR